MQQITIEVEPAVAGLFGKDGPGRARTRRLTQLLERHLYVLERAALPAFSEPEWETLLEAFAGMEVEPARELGEVIPMIEQAFEDWDLGRAHGVDARALAARLRGLDAARTVALVERLEAVRAERRCARDAAEARVVAFPGRR